MEDKKRKRTELKAWRRSEKKKLANFFGVKISPRIKRQMEMDDDDEKGRGRRKIKR